MRKFCPVLWLFLFTCPLIACVLPCLAQERIVVAGTGDSVEVFKILAVEFEKDHPGQTIDVPASIGSGGGVRCVSKGQCDLGRVARPPEEQEAKYDVKYRALAHTPLVCAVNPNVVGVDDLTDKQLLGILSGGITDWKDVGGYDGKIYVVQREFGDSARTLLEKKLPGFKELPQFTGYTAYSAAEALKSIRDNENTFGYVAYGAAKQTELKILKINGMYPSVDNIQKGRYQLVLTVGYVWKGDLTGLARAFFDFCYSEKGYAALINNGAVPAFKIE